MEPFFWHKKSRSLLSNMFLRHLLCVRTSSVLVYLHQLKCSTEYRKFYPGRIATFYRLKALQYVALVVLMGRIFYPSTLSREQVVAHFSLNPVVCAAMLHFRSLASPTPLKAVCLLLVFVGHIDYSIHFRVDARLVRVVHEMVVENGRHFKLLNRRRFHWPPEAAIGLANFWRLYQAYRRLYREIWICLSLRFHRETLDSFPQLSLKLRARLVVYSTLYQVAIAAFNVLFFIFLILLGTAFFFVALLPHLEMAADHQGHQLTLALAITDLLFLLFSLWNAVRLGLFAIHLLALFSFLGNGHMTEMNESLRIAVGQSQLAMFRYRFLTLFYGEYHRMRWLAWHTNQAVISQLMAAAFLSNIALNVVIIGHLLFRAPSAGERLVMVTVLSLQTVLGLLGCLALIGWSDCLAVSDRLLFRAQYLLGSSENQKGQSQLLYKRTLLSMAKLKLNTFYEQVAGGKGVSKEAFRFTLGSMGKISKKSLYEFFLAYTSIVMYVAKMVRKNRL